MNIVGYTDRLAAAPGETIRFMVSTRHDRFHAEIVRLFHGDPKPGGPGLKVQPVEAEMDGDYPGYEQPYRLGSYAYVEDPDGTLAPGGGFTLSAWIFPTTPGAGQQAILTRRLEHERRGYGLYLESGGDLGLRLDAATVRTQAPLRSFTWYSVSATVAPDGSVRLAQTPLSLHPTDPTAVAVQGVAPTLLEPPPAPFLIAGHTTADGPVGCFNGKVESPRIETAERVLAAWDFSQEISGERIVDSTCNGHDGRLVNLPMRAVTGRKWTGMQIDFKQAPDEYAAIFFHDDDLEDCSWTPSFELVVPEQFGSGVYAARLGAAEDEEWLPFFIRPPHGTASSEIAVLLPTLSYMAYGNAHASVTDPITVGASELWDYMQPQDHLAINVPLLSLYDRHRDGVGNCYTSRLKPLLNMRPQYHMAIVRSAHQFPADLHLIDWLQEKRFSVDVITDEDLHAEGEELLSRYRVVLTGSHPEYWTASMLDALEAWLLEGGRLMYLGGNGFYWVTSIDPARPHLIEVRRGRRGTSTWRSAPGEDCHSTTGEPGGLWRDRGRPPQRLVGVGMAAQGFDTSLPFHRQEGSRDPRAAWIFEGIPAGPIGDAGLVMDGAAGFELDRLDFALGTPPHALLLAAGSGFSDSYQHVVEEVEESDSQQGGSVSPFVRADMVFFELPNSGAVFSVSSIAWCGSLSHNAYDNSVSRITENVLRRFLSPESFHPDLQRATPLPARRLINEEPTS